MNLSTFKLRKHIPPHCSNGENIQVMASFDTFNECNECMELARTNVARNPGIVITVNDDGVVFVDGEGPEMDYYTIHGE